MEKCFFVDLRSRLLSLLAVETHPTTRTYPGFTTQDSSYDRKHTFGVSHSLREEPLIVRVNSPNVLTKYHFFLILVELYKKKKQSRRKVLDVDTLTNDPISRGAYPK